MRVAYLGPPGTHSEEALRASAPPDIEAVPLPTIYDAVMAVEEGTVDRAVVPIENALEGSVAVTLDTLATEAQGVRIAAEVVHPIHHCVVARPSCRCPPSSAWCRTRRPRRSARTSSASTCRTPST